MQQNPDGEWVPSQTEPYYPNIWESSPASLVGIIRQALRAYPWQECFKCRALRRLAE